MSATMASSAAAGRRTRIASSACWLGRGVALDLLSPEVHEERHGAGAATHPERLDQLQHRRLSAASSTRATFRKCQAFCHLIYLGPWWPMGLQRYGLAYPFRRRIRRQEQRALAHVFELNKTLGEKIISLENLGTNWMLPRAMVSGRRGCPVWRNLAVSWNDRTWPGVLASNASDLSVIPSVQPRSVSCSDAR
jgi:hypothetical protein